MLGETLGSYRVIQKLGEGGMGVVYLAEHALIGNKAAVKVLLPQFSASEEIVQRFFNEAKATTAIAHPGIVKVFDFGYHASGSAYLVMEFLEGESLDGRVRREHRLPLAEALRIAHHCASALSSAHAVGIVHRDLKPENMFLVPDPIIEGGERVKILDFGIAKLSDSPDGPGSVKTRTGSVMGTPLYMAPEQCRGAGEIDYRADIYALGCVVFRMLAGQPPHTGDGPGEIIANHLREPAPSLLAFDPALPPQIDAFVQRMLAKAPGDRQQSMAEIAAEAERLAREVAPGHPRAASAANPFQATMAAPSAPYIAQPGQGSYPGQAPPGSYPGQGAQPSQASGPGSYPGQGSQASGPGSYPGQASQPSQPGSYPGQGSQSYPGQPAGAIPSAAPFGGSQPWAESPGQHPGAASITTLGAAAGSSGVSRSGKRWIPVAGVLAVCAAGGVAAAVVLGGGGNGDGAATPVAVDAAPEAKAPVRVDAAPAPPDAKPPEPVMITVVIDSDPAGAAVFAADAGKSLGETPYTYIAAASEDEVTLRVVKRGYSDEEVTFRGDRDATFKIDMHRKRRRPDPSEDLKNYR